MTDARFCLACGKELPHGAVFCPTCGIALTNLSAKVPAPSAQTAKGPASNVPRKALRYGCLWVALIIGGLVVGALYSAATNMNTLPELDGGNPIVATTTPLVKGGKPNPILVAKELGMPTPTPKPTPIVYDSGKISDLPEKAQDVLHFVPADNAYTVNGESIANQIEHLCDMGGKSGTSQYVGSDDFPGKMKVSPPALHGWTHIKWRLPKCDVTDGGPITFAWDISQDGEHIQYKELQYIGQGNEQF